MKYRPSHGSPDRQPSLILHPRLSFFFNDTPTTEIYTLSLHDALPISSSWNRIKNVSGFSDGEHAVQPIAAPLTLPTDRKSTRLNSSHTVISYAVFCLKKKTQ